MKRRSLWMLILSAILVLTACALQQTAPVGGEGYLIYYLAPEESAKGSDAICSSYQQLTLEEDAPLRSVAEAVVNCLLEGGEKGLSSPIPSGVMLESLEIRDKRAYVDFSAGISRLEGVDLMLADYCLTLSLTALEGIDAVSITSQGRTVVNQPKRVFYERDVLLSTMDDVVQTVEATLYFLNEDGILVGEPRTLELYEGQSSVENLIVALLEGPENRGLTQVIPEDFQVNSIRVENGICYVNLPATTLELLPGETDQQELILWSLANSLYSLDRVEELRFLVSGQELEYFGDVPVTNVSLRPRY